MGSLPESRASGVSDSLYVRKPRRQGGFATRRPPHYIVQRKYTLTHIVYECSSLKSGEITRSSLSWEIFELTREARILMDIGTLIAQATNG
jgi:hypothetical protein